jgi:murein DD-endopeptidase MepM/ murein hydrolase activator NlpD
MHGGVNYPEAVLDIDTVNQLGVSLQYMRTIMAASQHRVEDISALEREHAALRVRLEELEQVVDEVRDERAAQRDEVAALVAGRREVKARLAAREHEHRRLLTRLGSSAERYRAAIDDLEAEGRAIEQRLARIAARQRVGGGRRPGAALQWPVNGVITSGYGYRTHPVLGYSRLHAGTDFGAATGTPIVAAAGGTVVSAGWMGGYGNAVVISHGGGLATLYAHQSRLAVGPGARVARGHVIGYVGSTGMSTGPHLHFEVRVNGVTTDPARYL